MPDHRNTGPEPSLQNAAQLTPSEGDGRRVPEAHLSGSSSAGTPAAGILALNVTLIGMVGVAVSGWLLHFTDLFPAVGGLLALGGLFSWLAFVSKILSEDRLKAFQAWIDDAVLSRRFTTVAVILVAAVLLGISLLRGTIAISTFSENKDRAVWVYAPGSDKGDALQLPPGGSIKVNLWTWPAHHTRYIVKVSGYPDQLVEVTPWRTSARYVPSSFFRPEVVLLPEPELIQSARNPGAHMEIRVDVASKTAGKRTWQASFDGHAFWVSCDDDLEVPATVADLWRARLAASVYQPFLVYWTTPRNFPCGDRVQLQANDSLTVTLFFNGQQYTDPHTFAVQPAPTTGSYLQEEVLHEPTSGITTP
jgi:hypothetical protein